MKRDKFSLSNYQLATMDMGELVPVGCYEVLPGDSIQQASSVLLRVSPLLAPVMHPIEVRIHHWFVPNRLVWSDWDDFITGVGSPTYPTITIPAAPLSTGSLADYLGIPAGTFTVATPVSAMPFRAYNTIFNEFYRDQDLVTEVAVDSTVLQRIAWQKDYFTAARPFTQKGAAVTVPLGSSAPVKTSLATQFIGPTNHPEMRITANNTSTGGPVPVGNVLGSGAAAAAGAGSFVTSGPATFGIGPGWYPNNLFADLSAATAANVIDVRRAFALQRYAEARAMYGSRYSEYLRYLGVNSRDARLDRPEYLGGGKQTISFSEVLQTTPVTGNGNVGELKGHGITALRSNRYRRFIEEHGHVISLMSVRPKTMYTDGLDRMWTRRIKEDYWQKELEAIGMQEVQNRELFGYANSTAVFGYNDRYSEYKTLRSGTHGDFRSTLNFWHLARSFASQPVLNSSFTNCDPGKRINAVQTADTLWAMVNHSIQARRLVKKSGENRII
jgi:Capsid protein (F protein)